jgi:hypothetical protein
LADDVSLTGTPTFTFSQSTVGTNIGITASGYSLSGVDASNYTLALPSFSANITQRPLTIGGALITPSSRLYDNSTAATISTPSALTLVNVPANDSSDATKIALASPVASFSDKNASEAKTVSLVSAELSGSKSANYTLSLAGAPTTTSEIAPRPLSVLITANNKVYDGTDTATVTYLDNRITGDLFTVTGTPTFNNKNVGNAKNVTANNIILTGTDAANYTQNTSTTATGNITARALTVTITANNKVYDGTDTATVTYQDNRITGDLFTVTGSASFSSKTVDTAKAVSASGITITGVDAANYTHNTTAETTANITQRPLSVTITANNKGYDATDIATVTYQDNRINGDLFTVSGTPTFSSKTVGTTKTVTASGIAITGTDAANYTHNTSTTTTANITARALTVTITASSKTYDGNTSASVVYTDDRVSGDLFTVSGTPTFSSKTVGTTKTVTASGIAITGTDAANYTHNTSTTTTANITARALTVTISADNKVYDGNTTASVVYTDDRVSGDVFTVTGTSTFSSKTVGTTKTVTATGITLSGTDATNYTGNTTATTTADISLRSLAVTITASSKTYDGTDTATVTYQDNRINGDLFTVTGTPTFNNKNVGNTKNVTANNIALTGTDAANYTQNITAVTNANITRRPLVVVVTAGNKTYDATTVAPVTYTDDRLAGDSFTISSSAFFVDEELGLNKLVTITNISLSGADADNYQPNTSSTSSANITVREITAHIQSQAGNTPLSDSTPSVQLGLLVPNIDTTVTFTRTGYSSVVCTFTPQNVSDTCTSPALADGTWSYRGRQLIAGLMVAASEPSTITIDTTAPLATRPVAFQSNSDTGTNTSDGVTNDSTPTVVISQASPTDSVVVTATSTSQVVQCSFTATASAQTCVLPTLSDGSWTITAVITDQANNSSASTPPFVAMIDTIAPTPSAAPFNAQDNGATTSLVATPRISVSGVASGEIVTINGLSSKSETSSCSFIASPTLNFCEMSSMASGTWTLTSVASDLAGNSAAVSAPTQIIISAGLAPMTVAKSSLTPQPTTNRRENVVSVKFGNTAALAGVQSVSFIVHDKSGKVVRRTTLKMNPGDTGARIVIPRSLKGARVRVVTTNQCGVSEGAPRGFNVRPGSTAITVDQKTNVPVLAGQIVLPQIDFAASEIALDAKDKVQLDQVIKAMKGKCGTLLVSGFSRHNKTDSNRYLQNLADFRAQAVANYLSGKNLNMWINYQGFIIKSNDKSAGANRRVALYWNPS